MKTLLESGVHFGHRTNRWDPRMKPYIFTERNSIHIIDLQQTVQELKIAYDIVRDKVAQGGTVLFIGTKRQAQETIQVEAERCGMPYVIERWLPGTLTNWMTIHQRIMELERLEKLRDSGEIDRLVKKEGLMIERKIKRLLIHLSGIRHMSGVPDMIFVVDINREDTAVHEANLKKIPVVALVDTNCNPENIDHLIPCNDDAIRAIKLMAMKMADAVIEGKDMRKEEEFESKAPAPKDERIHGLVSQEEEIDDKDLLGEATLQKLAESKREAEEKAAAEAAKDAAKKSAEETAAEEVPEDAAEESAEETAAEEAPEDAAEESAEETAAEEAPEDAAEESAEETAAEEVSEDDAEESAKEPAKKSTKKSAKKSAKKSVEEAVEESTDEEVIEKADSKDETE
jgi:small subunit ribosomal protein S2